MYFGEQVMLKIEDIGQLATFIRDYGDEVEMELFGVRFWMPKELVHQVELEDEAA